MCAASNSSEKTSISQDGERGSRGCRAQDLGNQVLVVKRKALMLRSAL